MVLYTGQPLESDSIVLIKPDAGEVSAALTTADITGTKNEQLGRAHSP